MEKKIKKFKVPTQVAFTEGDEEVNYGIAYGKTIICACCGHVFKLKDVEIIKRLSWVEFKEAIGE